MPAHFQGEVLLAWLVFSDGQGAKRRPVLVVHDFGNDGSSRPSRASAPAPLRIWFSRIGKARACNCLQLSAPKNWRQFQNLAWHGSWARCQPPNWFGSKKFWPLSSNRFSSDKKCLAYAETLRAMKPQAEVSVPAYEQTVEI